MSWLGSGSVTTRVRDRDLSRVRDRVLTRDKDLPESGTQDLALEAGTASRVRDPEPGPGHGPGLTNGLSHGFNLCLPNLFNRSQVDPTL